MTRRSKEQRRTDYLDIGAEIVAQAASNAASEPGLALAHVKLADVADRAGVTKGALYHIWPSQEAFWHDLLDHLIETNLLFGMAPIKPAGSDGSGPDGASAPPTFRDYSNALFDSLSSDPIYFARISLFSYLDDESVRKDLDRSFRSAAERFLPGLDAALAAAGRRLAPGVTAWDFAVAIAALLDGLCLQFRIEPERTPDVDLGDGQRWTLFAVAAEGLLLGCTEPVDADGKVA